MANGVTPSARVTTLASQPGTSVPMLPGRTHPARLEITMWHSSVEPRPSRISTPNRSIHRSYNTLGKGSPAETQQSGTSPARIQANGTFEWPAQLAGT